MYSIIENIEYSLKGIGGYSTKSKKKWHKVTNAASTFISMGIRLQTM